jgi:DNA-binding response OmpR family regulator
MSRSRCALVVAATPSLAMKLCAWLKISGWQVVTAHSYPAAKARLEERLELVVTELELGDYNGLQLALRAQGYEIPALVVGRHDDVLEHEAEQLGATYLRKSDLDQHRFLVAVDVKLEAIRHATPLVCRNLEFVRRPVAGLRPSAVARRMLLH